MFGVVVEEFLPGDFPLQVLLEVSRVAKYLGEQVLAAPLNLVGTPFRAVVP